jgi:hypothetical protein
MQPAGHGVGKQSSVKVCVSVLVTATCQSWCGSQLSISLICPSKPEGKYFVDLFLLLQQQGLAKVFLLNTELFDF